MFEVTADEVVLVLIETPERITIKITDQATGAPVDATALSLRITDLGGTVVYADNILTPPTPPGITRIVHPAVGTYFFPLGDQSVIANNETKFAGELLAVWHIEVGADADNIVQTVKIVTPYVLHLVTALRQQIDKAVMQVVEDPNNPCFLGYTTRALLEYLEGGLSCWNMYEPYPTFCALDDFPHIYKQGLIEAALIVGIQSQELFAIAKDIPNYSAQGAAFVIQHQPQLAQFATRISQKLDKLIPIAKLKFVQSGSLHTQVTPNARLQQLINMAPNGALFRNTFLAG
jgi:hypothetical protein